ncbi:MAG: glycine cleavage system protein GcvH [Candidatus Bathyarchaeia archaeon]|nr:glycine cleavage system protein GcvH [Candidatus Bathyarchaeota archaeon]
MSEWRTVSVRRELIEEIEKMVKTGLYRSVSEFIAEAIRLRLEELMRARGVPAERRKEVLAKIQEQLLYTPKHVWVQVTPEGNIRMGLTDYAARHLKGIANVMTEPVGREVKRMEPIGMVETWMFIFDIYSPITGKIVKVNETLRTEPQLINEDPYGEGWILEIKPKNSLVLEEELKDLLTAREYEKWVSKIEGRLKE